MRSLVYITNFREFCKIQWIAANRHVPNVMPNLVIGHRVNGGDFHTWEEFKVYLKHKFSIKTLLLWKKHHPRGVIKANKKVLNLGEMLNA